MKAQLAKYDGPRLKAQLVKTKDKVKQLTDDVKRQSTAYSSLKKDSKVYQQTITDLKEKLEEFTANAAEDAQSEIYNYVSDCGCYAVISTHFKSDTCQPPTHSGLNYRVLNRETGASPLVRYENGQISYTEAGDIPADVEEYLHVSIGVVLAAEKQKEAEEQ